MTYLVDSKSHLVTISPFSIWKLTDETLSKHVMTRKSIVNKPYKVPFWFIPFKPIQINSRVAMISTISCDFSKDKTPIEII